MTDTPSIVPYLSYVDGKAAMDFLERAFGMERVQAYDDEGGRLVHGEMRYGNGVVMIGSIDATIPKQSPGIYLVVADVDAHYARAAENGADIVYPPEDTEFGTRRYRARDPEGHEWSFGTYAPQTEARNWG